MSDGGSDPTKRQLTRRRFLARSAVAGGAVIGTTFVKPVITTVNIAKAGTIATPLPAPCEAGSVLTIEASPLGFVSFGFDVIANPDSTPSGFAAWRDTFSSSRGVVEFAMPGALLGKTVCEARLNYTAISEAPSTVPHTLQFYGYAGDGTFDGFDGVAGTLQDSLVVTSAGVNFDISVDATAAIHQRLISARDLMCG